MKFSLSPKRAAACLILLGLIALTRTESALAVEDYKGPPIRVYLFTASTEGGFVDDESKARTHAVSDLRKRLAESRWITLVEARGQSQVVLEVLGRKKEATGDYHKSVWNKDRTNAVKVHVVRAKLTVGDYETELVGDTETAIKRKAAGELGERLENWIKKNGARVHPVCRWPYSGGTSTVAE
jgi:hypothetical protein